MRHGQRAASATILGICVAVVVQGFASGVGLSALLAASAHLFLILKLLGAAYLVWIGLRSIFGPTNRAPDERGEQPRRNALKRFREGLLSNLLNPKVTLLYLALLPQFVAPSGNIVLQSTFLGAIHALMGIVWLSFYSRALTRVARTAVGSKLTRWMQRVSGVVLIALGTRVATARR
ncbi:MAG TPA: LysE family translocator [Actinomycetota bacterium]|nr:LysE family translocator [Actinomycetota bacterium]